MHPIKTSKLKARKGQEIDVFEEMRILTGAEYISDLRRSPFREQAIRLISRADEETCTLQVWNDLVEYLLREGPCETPATAKQLFVSAVES